MVVKHNIINDIISRRNRKCNDLLLVKDLTIYKFALENINDKVIDNNKLNVKVLSKRYSELSELPSNECSYYDKIIIDGHVIFEKKITIKDKIKKLYNFIKNF